MGDRQRIKAKGCLPKLEADPLKFTRNKSSGMARLIGTSTEHIQFNVWLQYHCFDRQQFGDENGKREGIELETIRPLVSEAIKHLIFYASKLKLFSFIDEDVPPGKHLRIVIRKEAPDGIMVNVATETHFLSPNEYEISMVTAMKDNGFFIAEGQYVIELLYDGDSALKKMDHGKLVEIYSVEL